MNVSEPTDHQDDLDLLRAAAVAAGIIAAGYFRRTIKHWTKANASPVTEADTAVDAYLRETLLAERPDYGWLSEETTDGDDRLSRRMAFVVDPIDGTRGFMQGDDQWTISLAVVEAGEPVAAVVYAPARDELYDAIRGGGARWNGRALVAERRAAPDPLIPAPGAVHADLEAQGLRYRRGPYSASLAYRLVQVATGKFDAAVARRGAQDWDIAGAALILAEAGVDFADVCVERMRFNKPDIRHGALAATADPRLKPMLHAALRRVYGCPDEASATVDQAGVQYP